MEVVVALTIKGKVVDIKQVRIGYNRTEAAFCYSENSYFKKRPQQQQLASSSYQRTQPLVNFLTNTCLHTIRFQCSTFVENEKLFPLQEMMCKYNKSVESPYDPTKLAIHSILRPEDDLISNCGLIIKKTDSFEKVVHFIDEESMVTYDDFDCGITFFPENPTKIRQIN